MIGPVQEKDTNVSVKANRMTDGTYKDQITGNTFRVSGGTITGRIGSTGIAVVYNAEECSHQSHDKAGLCTACRTYVGHSYDANDRCSCGQERPQGRTVYFSNTAGWSNVNIYSWYT